MTYYEIRMTLLERSKHRCESCGGPLTGPFGYSLHHRRPRGMGGSKDPATNRPSNFLVVCGSGTTGCHGRLEQNRKRAYESGYLVRRGHHPMAVPIYGYPGATGPIWLGDDGQIYTTSPQEREPR